MSLADDVREAVATIDEETKDLQAVVLWYPWIRDDGMGKKIYGGPIPLDAIVNKMSKLVKTANGQEVVATTYIGILEEVAPNGAPKRHEPIDERDKFVLPDGTSGTILKVDGLIDAGTNAPYFSEVYLG
jgi:hypothetical protein